MTATENDLTSTAEQSLYDDFAATQAVKALRAHTAAIARL
jgi:hypothetical protein